MNSEIVVGLLAFAGTTIGTFGGIITSSKLTNFRLQELEKKVDKHNNFAMQIPVLENRIKVCEHRLDDLEKKGE